MHLSFREIYFKAFFSMKVIVWCIWVFRLVKYCNQLQLNANISVYWLWALICICCMSLNELKTTYQMKFDFIFTIRKNVLRKPNSHQFQLTEIKRIRRKPENIFKQMLLEPVLLVWSPMYKSQREKDLCAINNPTVLQKQDVQGEGRWAWVLIQNWTTSI